MDINPEPNQNPQNNQVYSPDVNSGIGSDPLPPNQQAAPSTDVPEVPVSQVSPDPITVPSLGNSLNHEVSQPTSPEVSPIAVVRVLSPRGVEYVFMTIALFGSAIGLSSTIISVLNGETSFSVLAYPTAILVVSVPVFAFFFLRLKKSELYNPSLKLDPSKRRSTQFIQIASFVIAFLTLIGLVSAIFAKMSGSYGGSAVKLVLDALVILVISGGILLYYWHDEHRR